MRFVNVGAAILAAFLIFTLGMLIGMAVENKPQQQSKASDYLSHFSDDSANCYEQGEWIVCAPKRAQPGAGAENCLNGYGNVVPCGSKEEMQ